MHIFLKANKGEVPVTEYLIILTDTHFGIACRYRFVDLTNRDQEPFRCCIWNFS